MIPHISHSSSKCNPTPFHPLIFIILSPPFFSCQLESSWGCPSCHLPTHRQGTLYAALLRRARVAAPRMEANATRGAPAGHVQDVFHGAAFVDRFYPKFTRHGVPIYLQKSPQVFSFPRGPSHFDSHHACTRQGNCRAPGLKWLTLQHGNGKDPYVTTIRSFVDDLQNSRGELQLLCLMTPEGTPTHSA